MLVNYISQHLKAGMYITGTKTILPEARENGDRFPVTPVTVHDQPAYNVYTRGWGGVAAPCAGTKVQSIIRGEIIHDVSAQYKLNTVKCQKQ